MDSNIRPILLVEDDGNDAELVQIAFKKSNLANPVIVARDGVEALKILRQGRRQANGARSPVVVLLDFKMPKMNGLEVLQQIKGDDQLKHIPVVMMTSSCAEPDLQRAYELGVNAYVVKPVEFGAFVEAVKLIGKFWAVLNELPVPGGHRSQEAFAGS